MRILDKYITKEYLKYYVIILISFTVIFLVVDFFDNLPRLMRRGATWDQMSLYFAMRLPYLVILTSPVVVLLAGLFLMNELSHYSESIAMRSAGISIVRMVTPLFWVGFAISLLVLVMGEYVLPWSEAKRDYVYTVLIKNQKIEDKKMRSNIYYQGTDNNLYFIGFFDGYRNTLKTIDISNFDMETGEIYNKIIADRATWEDGKWVFQNCYIRHFEQQRPVSSQFFPLTTLDFVDVTPQDFIKSAKDPMSMNFFELKEYIGRLQKVGESYHKELTELFYKVTFPLANLIILLFCIPLASASARSKGRGVIFGIGLLVCFMYLMILRLGQSLGHSGVIEPLMAAVAPHILFLVIGLYFLVKAEV
ncbi:MAG: LptF/LptG family permease [Candidatus Cloacimonetes bacterium]|nr:LptF/LptG family permease [Candidatus Cloacimonadota bacterium]